MTKPNASSQLLLERQLTCTKFELHTCM